MNNKFEFLFSLQDYYGKDFEILKTSIDRYPIYEDDQIREYLAIAYFDIKIYGEYVFIGVHQNSDETDFLKYDGKTYLLNYFQIPTQLFKLIPLQDEE